MATEKGKAAFEYLMKYMKANAKAVYADAAEAAKKAGHAIYPIMWGRAQALLGRVKMKPRGKKAAAAPAGGKRRGRPPGSGKLQRAAASGAALAVDTRDLPNAQALVDALNAGRRAALRYEGGAWVLTAG